MRKRRVAELGGQLDGSGAQIISWTSSFFVGACTGVVADGLLRVENGGVIPPDVDAGFQTVVIEKAIESHRQWERSQGLMSRFIHDPAALSNVFQAVRAFFDAQYSYDEMRSILPRRTFEPGIVPEEFDALMQRMLSSILHRTESVYSFWRAASQLEMDTSPTAVASIEMEFFAEGLRGAEEIHRAKSLPPPLNLFRDADLLRLHFVLAEFCWASRCAIAWPLDVLATAGMDRTSSDGARVEGHHPGAIDANASEDSKVCPDCAETIKSAANVCRYCGYRFPDAMARTESAGPGSARKDDGRDGADLDAVAVRMRERLAGTTIQLEGGAVLAWPAWVGLRLCRAELLDLAHRTTPEIVALAVEVQEAEQWWKAATSEDEAAARWRSAEQVHKRLDFALEQAVAATDLEDDVDELFDLLFDRIPNDGVRLAVD